MGVNAKKSNKSKRVNSRWEKKAKTETEHERPPPSLTRRLTPMSELLESLLETETISSNKTETSSSPANEERCDQQRLMSGFTITEETPPPSLTRNLTPMSNLLESLLKVRKCLNVFQCCFNAAALTAFHWHYVHLSIEKEYVHTYLSFLISSKTA